MKDSMYTRWGRALSPEHVLQEYPRPGLVRESYLNLNGTWEYAFTKTEKLPDRYEGQILVPFSPEAPLSGVNRQLQPDEVLHYKRVFRIEASDDDESESRDREAAFREGSTGERDVRVARPAGVPKRRWLLHFGAVDQMCSVYVDHRKVGSHTGGYLPFTFDVTDAVKRDVSNVLCVQVLRWCDGSYLEDQDMFRMSGLFRDVSLFAVPSDGVFRVETDLDADFGTATVRVEVETYGDVSISEPLPWTAADVQAEGRVDWYDADDAASLELTGESDADNLVVRQYPRGKTRDTLTSGCFLWGAGKRMPFAVTGARGLGAERTWPVRTACACRSSTRPDSRIPWHGRSRRRIRAARICVFARRTAN